MSFVHAAGSNGELVDGQFVRSSGLRGEKGLSSRRRDIPSAEDCETTSQDDTYIYKVFPPQQPICRDAHPQETDWPVKPRAAIYNSRDFGPDWEFFDATDETLTNEAMADHSLGTYYTYFMSNAPVTRRAERWSRGGKPTPAASFIQPQNLHCRDPVMLSAWYFERESMHK